MTRQTIISIGNFDGVHRGHTALIHHARTLAGPSGRVIALSFDPHPLSHLSPGREPARLSSHEQRALWLTEAGADEVHRLEPTHDLLSLPPDAFIDSLVQRFSPTAFVEGPDFHFGHKRSGNVNTLTQLGRSRNFQVHIVPPIQVDLTDQTVVTASSTITRWLLSNGRVRDAARILGRPYEIHAIVVRGDQRGRTIGFPTANLRSSHMPPAHAVYAGLATLPDGSTHYAAIHVGPRSTFDALEPTIEPYIIDWAGPAAHELPEYGWPLRLRFIAWLRGQARFESVNALVEQMHHDVARARDILSREFTPSSLEIPA